MRAEEQNIAKIGGTWEDANPDSNSAYNKYDKESREKLVNELLPNGVFSSRVLDLGCSIGVWGEFLRRKGYAEIYGVDISEERLKEAETRGYYQTKVAHGTNLPYPNNFFDSVICIDVLVHVGDKKDREKTILEALRVLKKGGTLVFSIANADWFKESRDYCFPITVEEAKSYCDWKKTEVRGLQFIYPNLLVKLPFVLKIFDKLFSNSFLKNKGRVIFFKVVK